jgi:hypothetical protein
MLSEADAEAIIDQAQRGYFDAIDLLALCEAIAIDDLGGWRLDRCSGIGGTEADHHTDQGRCACTCDHCAAGLCPGWIGPMQHRSEATR